MRLPRARRSAARVSLALVLLTRLASAERIGVVSATAEAEAAAHYLEEQVDSVTERRTARHARAPDLLIGEARGWGDDLVVVLDPARRTVSVVRPADGTVGSRTLSRGVVEVPYAVALAAVELLQIVREAPIVRRVETPPKVAPPPAALPWLSLDVGLVQSAATNGDIVLLQPTAGADVAVLRTPESSWLSLGLHATGLAPMQREQVLVLPEGVEPRGVIEYERSELSLRTSFGHRYGVGAAVAFTEVGLAFVTARARDASDRPVASDSHAAFWLGAGGELRYSLVGGLSLGLGVGCLVLPVTTRFHASPPRSRNEVTALAEGNLDLRARLSVLWELPP